MSPTSGAGSQAVTAVLVVCALTVTALAVRREVFPPPPPPPPIAPRFALEKSDDGPDLARYGNWIGPRDAKVVLVEFADFQCPACRVLSGQIAALRAKYPSDFAVVYRHWPLPTHPFARQSAIATECAAREGRFEEMHNLLFARRDSIGIAPWRSFAVAANIADLDSFDRCSSREETAATVDRDAATAQGLRSRGTPTVFVGGVRFVGAPAPGVLDSIVAAALEGSRHR